MPSLTITMAKSSEIGLLKIYLNVCDLVNHCSALFKIKYRQAIVEFISKGWTDIEEGCNNI